MSDQSTHPRTGLSPRALLVSERIDTVGLERDDLISNMPMAFRAGKDGVVALFRYGVVVFIGMSALEEDEALRQLDARIIRPTTRREEESTRIEIAPDKE